MQRSMSAGIAAFAAVASAEVLIRVAVVSDLSDSSKHVLLPLAIGGLACSLVLFAAFLVSRSRTLARRTLRRPV
jgi:hypothetical protein